MNMDENGQPLAAKLHSRRISVRMVDEFVGICRGLLFSGDLTEEGVRNLHEWILFVPGLSETWPASEIYEPVVSLCNKKNITNDEINHIHDLIRKLLGGVASFTSGLDYKTGELLVEFSATEMAMTDIDDLEIVNNVFVLSGKFISGTRDECAEVILKYGGTVQKNVTKNTNYIVVGSIGSRDWAHSSWGLKIEKAIEYRSKGVDIKIISEKLLFDRIESGV